MDEASKKLIQAVADMAPDAIVELIGYAWEHGDVDYLAKVKEALTDCEFTVYDSSKLAEARAAGIEAGMAAYRDPRNIDHLPKAIMAAYQEAYETALGR